MWDTVANVFLNIYSRWADRPVVSVDVKRLQYDLIRNEPDSVLVVITPYPSRYYAEIGFSHRGKATTIKNVMLIIDSKIEATGFTPLKLEHGDYHEETLSFPVSENSAVKEGTFEIQAIDGFNKVYKCRGHFPIQTQTQP
ncbi:MAG: hypothetical protein PHY28_03655 [Dehalococcoidales bacterium]|nr:hypothetical protein [Dehalococcoidales bacterium]